MYPHNRKTTRATCPHFFFEGHRIKWAKKANIWPNMAIFEPKIHFWGHGVKLLVSSIREPMRKFLKSLMFILEKGTFFFEQLFPVVARTWLGSKSGTLFQFLAKKSDFCHTTPILVDDPFLALGMKVNFPPWKRFFDFPFWSYSCFRKKIRLTAQKVFPPPTVGAPSASNSPSALSARALRSRALRAWA